MSRPEEVLLGGAPVPGAGTPPRLRLSELRTHQVNGVKDLHLPDGRTPWVRQVAVVIVDGQRTQSCNNAAISARTRLNNMDDLRGQAEGSLQGYACSWLATDPTSGNARGRQTEQLPKPAVHTGPRVAAAARLQPACLGRLRREQVPAADRPRHARHAPAGFGGVSRIV